MDVHCEIQQLKKLIVTAEGETLDYLVEQLHTLLTNKELKDKPYNTRINQQKQIQNQ
jgi:hypothetical protein